MLPHSEIFQKKMTHKIKPLLKCLSGGTVRPPVVLLLDTHKAACKAKIILSDKLGFKECDLKQNLRKKFHDFIICVLKQSTTVKVSIDTLYILTYSRRSLYLPLNEADTMINMHYLFGKYQLMSLLESICYYCSKFDESMNHMLLVATFTKV